MKLLLHAVFNEALPGYLLHEIKAQGYDGIRIDAQNCGAAQTNLLADDAIRAGLWPLVIVRDAAQLTMLPHGVDIEVRNEPDIGTNERLTPAQYVDIASECVNVAQAHGLGRVWIGAVSNLNRRGLDFLYAVFSHDWPGVGCSVHRYPHGGYDELPTTPHAGLISRDAEIAELKQIIGDRPWGVSELGYHQGLRCKGFWIFKRCRWWSRAEVVRNLQFERTFFAHHGAEFLTVYQINDGAGSGALDTYGRRDKHGTWKTPAFP